MKKIAKFAGVLIAAILLLDVFGFLAWASSGQRPVDNFYIGTITTHALQTIIK